MLIRFQSLSRPTQLMAGLFLLHYLNRSTISCLRTPTKRSPMHIITMLSAILFNLANGSLIGSWLGGRTSPLPNNEGALPSSSFGSFIFWVGLGLMTVGFIGNIYHDEILYNLRRPNKDGEPKPRYSIPYGGLYSNPLGGISFPSYICEWVEWSGFALACSAVAPPPALPFTASSIARSSGIASSATHLKGLFNYVLRILANILPVLQPILEKEAAGPHPLTQLSTYTTPLWLFLYAEIVTMLPRALKGHAWYKNKFRADLPRDRRAIIPGLL